MCSFMASTGIEQMNSCLAKPLKTYIGGLIHQLNLKGQTAEAVLPSRSCCKKCSITFFWTWGSPHSWHSFSAGGKSQSEWLPFSAERSTGGGCKRLRHRYSYTLFSFYLKTICFHHLGKNMKKCGHFPVTQSLRHHEISRVFILWQMPCKHILSIDHCKQGWLLLWSKINMKCKLGRFLLVKPES